MYQFPATNQAGYRPSCLRLVRHSIGTQALWLLVTAFAQLLSVQRLSATPPECPNVVLIMADDMGYSDAGCFGGEIQTPHLDAIAAEGLRYTQFYNTGRCWPTRAALLTGYYAQQVRRDTVPGIPSGGRGTRPEWAMLLPRLLAAKGYRSYHTGKWHIDGMPLQNGFDHSYYLKDQGRYFSPKKHWKDDQPLPPVSADSGFYATTALADHVIEVLQEHQHKYPDRPFFSYIAFAAPHFPLHALPQDIAVYKDRYQVGWESVRQQRWQRMTRTGIALSSAAGRLSPVERNVGPPYFFPDAFQILGPGEVRWPLPWNSLTNPQRQFQAAKMSLHAAMIHRMDIELGRVFQQIRAMEQWDNTLIIFLSDNGASAEIMVRDDGHNPQAPPGSAETYLCLGPGWSTVANTPFRRHKTWTHEGGISTPLIMSWPNGIKQRGQLRQNPGHVIDIVPTILDVAGIEAPQGEGPVRPGKSLVPTWTEDHSVERSSFWWFHDGHRAVRAGKWKAVAPVFEPWELYDITRDRAESVDLAVAFPDVTEKLSRQWEDLLKQFTRDATQDLPKNIAAKALAAPVPTSPRNPAQAAALPARSQNLLNADTFLLKGRHAFIMKPTRPDQHQSATVGRPWICYAPTLPAYPDKAEQWMHEQFLQAGVAVAGIDVGEAYGSPQSLRWFDALYDHMVSNGYSRKPAMLGRSRGGLWVSSWAIARPERIAAIGGIYPVFDYTTYPGVERAATAYALSPDVLLQKQDELNPVRRASVLAKAQIPMCIIHGTADKVVPLEKNTAAVADIYRKEGAGNLIQVITAEGQGHSFWHGYFHCQQLVDFLIRHAQNRK